MLRHIRFGIVVVRDGAIISFFGCRREPEPEVFQKIAEDSDGDEVRKATDREIEIFQRGFLEAVRRDLSRN